MIGDRIRQLRLALQLKQVDMARDMKINASALSQLESGRTKPSLETITELGNRYKVDLHWLITGEGLMFGANESKELPSKGWDNFKQILDSRLEEIVQARQDMLTADIMDIPVSGEIAAGLPLENTGDTVDVVTVRRSMIHGVISDYMALRVNGRSMEPDIRHNDVVLIKQSSDWSGLAGKICAVRIDGAITLKKMMLDDVNKTIVLVPLNDDFQPILVNPEHHTDVALLGSLFYLYRVLK